MNSSTLLSKTNTIAREASFIHPRAGSDSDQHFSAQRDDRCRLGAKKKSDCVKNEQEK
jgi:hypothetical protein